MASSKNSPGPHDRRDPDAPRPKCIHLNRLGVRCAKPAGLGHKLCATHARIVKNGGVAPRTRSDAGAVKAGMTTSLNAKARASSAALVVSEQSRSALRKLRIPEASSTTDPRKVLLDTVASAWNQRMVWEGMLAAIPEEDWDYVGTPPIPGSRSSAKGARIEIIQRNLGEATKSAARISKLAIDAGIEERLVRLAEEQAALVADTVRAGLIAGISALARQGIISAKGEEAALAVAIGEASAHLRALAAGVPDASHLPVLESEPEMEIIEGVSRPA